MTTDNKDYMPKDALDEYIEHITPTIGDPTYSILRSHLLFEDLLRRHLDTVLPHPEVLEGARLTFAHLLVVARAASPKVPADHWMWKAMGDLNGLRNMLAHKLKSDLLGEKINKYVTFVVANLGKPLPPMAMKKSDMPSDMDVFSKPVYGKVDMATIGLYAFALTAFDMPLAKSSPENNEV